MTKLYKVQRTQRSKLEHARLVAESEHLPIKSIGNLDWQANRDKIAALDPVEHSVAVLNSGEWRVTRLPDYRSGAIMFDSAAKEYVKITNGSCVLSHFDGDARYMEEHPNGMECAYAPSEAIALRPIVNRDGSVSVAWTYRAVNPCDLERLTPAQEAEAAIQFAIAADPSSIDKKTRKAFIGRI